MGPLFLCHHPALDRFIKEQFQRAGAGFLSGGRRVQVVLNPENEYRIEEGDRALVIA